MNPPTSDLRPPTASETTVDFDPFPLVSPAPLPAAPEPPSEDAPQFPADKYAAAIAAERENRDYAFLGLDREICGLPVRQMSLRQFLIRVQIGCPFLCGEIPEAGDVASFLWFLSPDFSTKKTAKRAAFIAKVAAIPYAELVREVNDYIAATFMDAPPSGRGNGKPPSASVAATYIDIFASDYGWTIEAILDAPLVQLYQLLRERAQRRNAKAILFNRLSDKVLRDFTVALNEFNVERARVRVTSFQPVETTTTKPDPTEGSAQ